MQNELGRIGLGNLVAWVDVVVSYHPLDHWRALGWYGMAPHTITIPRFGVGMAHRIRRLQAWWGSHQAAAIGLRDVLRHEYGHALRDCLGRFDCTDPLWGSDPCVSAYAASQRSPADRADEDFADTFMLALKHRGRRPRSWLHPRLRQKWGAMGRAIAAGNRVRLRAAFRCPGRHCGTLLTARTGGQVTCPTCGSRIELR